MKKGILSICIAIIGFYFVYWYNVDLFKKWNIFTEQSKEHSNIDTTIFKFARTFTITCICIGLLSLYFGIISFLKKHKTGGIGIILAIVLIIVALIPFWQLL